LAGKSEGLESRIGRWRRVYDENGEESVLGWGVEQFTDLLPAALINPLPAMGISLEIRGNILEVQTLEERLKILEMGLVRSIQNLKGERPF